MDNIRFTDRELELIKLCINVPKENFVNFSSEEKQKMIDAVSDYFIKHGLKKNDEPNQLGMELEDLLDKLNKF